MPAILSHFSGGGANDSSNDGAARGVNGTPPSSAGADTAASNAPTASSGSYFRPKSPFRKLLANGNSSSSTPSPPPVPSSSRTSNAPTDLSDNPSSFSALEAAQTGAPFHQSQLDLIRGALGKEEQLIRVSDSTTGEVYDLHIRRSDPYAVPRGGVGPSSSPSGRVTGGAGAVAGSDALEAGIQSAVEESEAVQEQQSSSAGSSTRGPKILRLPQLVSKRASAGLALSQQQQASMGDSAPASEAESSGAAAGVTTRLSSLTHGMPLAAKQPNATQPRAFGYRNSASYNGTSLAPPGGLATSTHTSASNSTSNTSNSSATVPLADRSILPPSPPTSDEAELPPTEDEEDEGEWKKKSAQQQQQARSRYTTADFFGPASSSAGASAGDRSGSLSGRSRGGGSLYDTASEDEGPAPEQAHQRASSSSTAAGGAAGWMSSIFAGITGDHQPIVLTSEPEESALQNSSQHQPQSSSSSSNSNGTHAAGKTQLRAAPTAAAAAAPRLLHSANPGRSSGSSIPSINTTTNAVGGVASPSPVRRTKTTSGGSATLSAVHPSTTAAAAAAPAAAVSSGGPKRPPSAGSLATQRSSRRSSRERTPTIDITGPTPPVPASSSQPGQSTTAAASSASVGAVPPSQAPAPTIYPAASVRTGDASFDEEASKNAERLLRQRRAKQQQEAEEQQQLIASPSAADASAILQSDPQALGEASKPAAGGRPGPGSLVRRGSRAPRERSMTTGGFAQIVRDAAQSVGASVSGPLSPSLQSPTDQQQQQQAQVGLGQLALQQLQQEEEQPQVLVGNLIGEDHVNYVLMYNMLTGIRIGVSRCQAKMKRPLTDDDYKAKHKFTFDIIGNELTPSAKYDFKFKDYAPWVFRELREYFHLDPADYLLSLTAKYILSELGSPGKSGSFFYFSRDYRFIIKTIRHSEHKFLLTILKDYHEHVKANPHTLLSRFYGLHRVKLPRGRKIHFVIMNNLFPPHRDIHETYDLKGSIIGREYPEEKAAQKKGAVMKDINWLRRNRKIELGPEKRALFEAQLKSDVELLKRLNIMDYSLLIGLHDMHRGNREGLRQEKLQVFQPETGSNPPLKREPSSKNKRLAQKDASALRAAVRREGPKSLTSETQLPTQDFSERRNFFFYQDEGGFRSTNENDEPTAMIYYLGVIDLFTPYTSVKRGETWWKGMTQDRHMISSVPPKEYGERFFKFMMMCANKAATWPGWKDKAKPLAIDISANGEPQHGLEKTQDPQSTAPIQQNAQSETISEKPEDS